MIKTVIFDLDDTLYDEIEYCKSGFKVVSQHVAAENPLVTSEQIFNQFWHQFTTGDKYQVFNNSLDALKIPCSEELISKLVNLYRNHFPDLPLPEGSARILKTLLPAYELALLTDGFMPAQKLKVEALGIEKFFKIIIYTEELGREHWKPSPLGFERILDFCDTKPEKAVYVGDNLAKDFIAPNQLGCQTIWLNKPGRIHDKPAADSSGLPKHQIDSLAQLPKLLKNL